MMNNLTIRQIRTFLAVAKSGSFRRASEIVHLSQPAVTSQVQQIESVVGVRLFNRTTRRVRLTVAGERFRVRAEQIIDDLDSTILELRDEAALKRGTFFVACVPTIASRVLPKVIASFGIQFPGILIRVYDVPANETLDYVTSGKVDIGIAPRPPVRSQFNFQPLTDDTYVAVVRRDDPWAGKKFVTLKQFAAKPLLTLPRGTNVRDTLESAAASQSIELTPLYEVQNHYTLGGMVEAGLGITALPSMAVSLMSQPLLRTIPIRKPAITREVGIVTIRGNELTSSARAFVRVFEKQIAQGAV